MRFFFTTLALCICSNAAFSQTDTVIFTQVSEYPYPALFTAYTARFDRMHRPYIYTANKEYGVIIFDFSDPQNLKPLRTISTAGFQGMKPTDLYQQGNYLYVSLGGFGGLVLQDAGMAVVDISDPVNAGVLGIWTDTSFQNGSAAIRVEGDYAYLGAMEYGVIILDISNPNAPKYLSHVTLDLNWPVVPGPFTVPHARGLAIRGDELWTAFDAGGLRLIDISNKNTPVEKAKYINTDLTDVAAPAYNTCTIVGDQLFVSVDYCGIDVVDISTPTLPQNTAWANPWNCTVSNWDGRPGHTNQVVTACNDSLLFASGADTEVIVYSIADPSQPRRIGQHAFLLDSVATWGVDVNDSLVVLAQVWNPLNFPYLAKKGGIRLLRWECPKSTSGNYPAINTAPSIKVMPNPFQDYLQIQLNLAQPEPVSWKIYDLFGGIVLEGKPEQLLSGSQVITLETKALPNGVFVIELETIQSRVSKLIVKN